MAAATDIHDSHPPSSTLSGPVWNCTGRLYDRYEPGILRFTDGRLTFTHDDGSIGLDAPTGELHGIRRCEGSKGISVWHGTTYHRLLLGLPPRGGRSYQPGDSGLGGMLFAAMDAADGASADHAARPRREQWMALLGPIVAAEPPPDVSVHRPHVRLRRLGFAAALTVALLAIVVALAIPLHLLMSP